MDGSEDGEREYYEWLAANAFVNNNKINVHDNNTLARSLYATHLCGGTVRSHRGNSFLQLMLVVACD